MALALVATAGASNANSYTTVTEADSYHEGHLYASLWVAATATTKAAALVMATRILESEMGWEGFRMTTTQSLSFPRGGLVTQDGVNISDATIPGRLRDATAEFARWLITSDRTADTGMEGIKYIQVESIKIVPGGPLKKEVIPNVVVSMLKEYGRKRSNVKHLVRC